MHDGFTDNRPLTTTIQPGSRPSSKFDYDPSVSCEDNPSPPHCAKWLREQEEERQRHIPYYARIAFDQKPVFCVDFYNQSDGLPLWWQALQKEAIFNPKTFALYLNNTNECTNHTLFHFYLHNRSNETMEKYDVEWRGERLLKKNKKNPYQINICYTDNNLPKPYQRRNEVGAVFLMCLLRYGKLANLVLNYPIAPNNPRLLSHRPRR